MRQTPPSALVVAGVLALARFQDPCFLARDCTDSLRSGLLQTFAAMFETLTHPADREAVFTIGHNALASSDWESVIAAMSIVSATCDQDLQRQVLDITRGPRQLAVMSEGQINSIMSEGTQALQKCADRSR